MNDVSTNNTVKEREIILLKTIKFDCDVDRVPFRQFEKNKTSLRFDTVENPSVFAAIWQAGAENVENAIPRNSN